jgi:peroxiredoxin
MADAQARFKKYAVFGVLAVLVVLFALVLMAKNGKKSGPIEQGDRAPDFRLTATDGKTVSLSDFKGKVALVHFWATWCPPCVEEIPTIAALAPYLREHGIELLAVSVDEGGADAVTAFLRERGLSVPVLMDPDRMTASSYGTFMFPETYVVGRDGKVKRKVIGPIDWRDPAVKTMLEEAAR